MLAGLLVLFSIIAAVTVVILLGGALEQFGKRKYTIRFDIQEGVPGLNKGSVVLLGGKQVGTVSDIRYEVEGSKVVAVSVRVGVDQRFPLGKDAVAYLDVPLLGGGSKINFADSGQGEPWTDSDTPIDGQIAPPSFLSSAGYGEDQKAQVQNIIRDAEKMIGDAKGFFAVARERSPNWFDRADTIFKNVDQATAKGPEIFKNFNDRVEDFRLAVQTVQKDYLDANREDVRAAVTYAKETLADAEVFSERLRTELADKAAGFLDDGRGAIANANEAVTQARGVLGENTPAIRRTLANFRLSSDQLLATLEEVRRSPWRLLYRPDDRELNFELLYDSARTYAGAVSDLRDAGDSLRALSAAGPVQSDAQKLGEMLGLLESAFEKYQEAEAEFLRQVRLHAGSEGAAPKAR